LNWGWGRQEVGEREKKRLTYNHGEYLRSHTHCQTQNGALNKTRPPHNAPPMRAHAPATAG